MQYITFQLSCKLYSGFQYKIDNEKIDFMTDEDIINDIKTKLKDILHTYNLEILKEGVDSLKLHLHDDFRNEKCARIIYICDHEH